MPKRDEIIVKKMPSVGNNVVIIVKPYAKKRLITGIVAVVLTKKKRHTRGHKVKLTTGEVGRIVEILS